MSPPEKSWKCNVCGYVHTGPEPPEMCPICGAPASEFTEVVPDEDTCAETIQDFTGSGEESTVSDVMVETMVHWGGTHVFGMVGHSNLGLADAVRRQCEAGRLSYVGVRHEGAAAFAESAFGKLTGRPAACLSIAGPGATNMLTGLWDARMDRIPILALTGQIDTQVLGPGAFQEVDLASAFSSVSTWSKTVLASSHHAELMNLALKNAILKRDVGHLIFPNEVQTLPADPTQVPGGSEGFCDDAGWGRGGGQEGKPARPRRCGVPCRCEMGFPSQRPDRHAIVCERGRVGTADLLQPRLDGERSPYAY